MSARRAPLSQRRPSLLPESVRIGPAFGPRNGAPQRLVVVVVGARAVSGKQERATSLLTPDAYLHGPGRLHAHLRVRFRGSGFRVQGRRGSGAGSGAGAGVGAFAPGGRPAPSFGLIRGSHSSHFGRYQFQSPNSFMVAGSRTPRMSVASMSTATARPTPSSLKMSSESVAKIAKTEIITIAALVTTPAVVLMP